MDRIGSTKGTSVVQMQRAAQKIRPESEQTTRVRFQESLALKQEQSLEMVQIMLHVSVSFRFVWFWCCRPTDFDSPLVRDVVLSPVCLTSLFAVWTLSNYEIGSFCHLVVSMIEIWSKPNGSDRRAHMRTSSTTDPVKVLAMDLNKNLEKAERVSLWRSLFATLTLKQMRFSICWWVFRPCYLVNC